MPTIMSHAIAGAALAQLLAPARVRKPLTVASIFCAMLPDGDVLGFAAGIAYGDMLGHRGFTHSILFASLAGTAGGKWFAGVRAGVCLGVATLSHGLLDATTDGGRGVGFLIPFSAERYFFPWTPVEVSPIGLGFFSARGLHVFASELLWIWIPSLVLLSYAFWRNRRTA
jgi:inner membrane protein